MSFVFYINWIANRYRSKFYSCNMNSECWRLIFSDYTVLFQCLQWFVIFMSGSRFWINVGKYTSNGRQRLNLKFNSSAQFNYKNHLVHGFTLRNTTFSPIRTHFHKSSSKATGPFTTKLGLNWSAVTLSSNRELSSVNEPSFTSM